MARTIATLAFFGLCNFCHRCAWCRSLVPQTGSQTVCETGSQTVCETGSQTVCETGSETVCETGSETVCDTGAVARAAGTSARSCRRW